MLRTFSRYLVVIVAAVCVAIALTTLDAQKHLADQQLEVTRANAEIAAALEQAIKEKILITEGIAAMFEAEPELTPDHFSRIVEKLVEETEDVINVAAAPGLVIEYVYPLATNRAALGFDLRDRPDFMIDIERAIAMDATRISGPFDLVQGGQGFITRSPVATPDGNTEAQEPWGIVSLVIGSEDLFLSSSIPERQVGLGLSIKTNDGRLLFGSEDLDETSAVQSAVQVSGIDWVVSSVPETGWTTIAPNTARLWAIVAAFAVVVMLVMRAFDWAFARSARAETQLMEAIEALDDGFALYDRDDRLILCNTRYKEIYRDSADAMIPGRTFEDILRHGLRKGQYKEAIGREDDWLKERITLHRSPTHPVEQRLANGRWLRVVERHTPSGNTVGFRVDITALKQALAKAERASAAKTDFLNTVSHELRTPLTVVLGYNAFLRNPERLPSYQSLQTAISESRSCALHTGFEDYQTEVRRFAEQIAQSGQELMSLINGILDLAAIEEGTLRLKREVLSIAPICRSVVDQFRPLAEQKGLKIELVGDATVVFANPQRLRQMLENLVGNAVKFTDTGTVTVRLETIEESVCVDVEDTGEGLTEEEMSRVFQRFDQLDASQSRAHRGVGLGLPISRELAEMHGGAVEVHSKKGHGSTFRLRLSAHRRREEQAA